MRKFRYIPHTADIAFEAYGSTAGEALENAALAMFGIMFDEKRLAKLEARERSFRISESAKSDDDAAWFTLQAILSKIQVGNLCPTSFKVSSFKKSSVKGTLTCKLADPSEYGLLEVKAVTPHELSVKNKSGVVQIKTVVDI